MCRKNLPTKGRSEVPRNKTGNSKNLKILEISDGKKSQNSTKFTQKLGFC